MGRRTNEAVWHISERPWSYKKNTRRSGRMRLPLPICVRVGTEERAAYCRDVGVDSLGVTVPGVPPRVGEEINVRMWVGGRKLDASAWVLRTGKTIGLRCPDVRRIYEILEGR